MSKIVIMLHHQISEMVLFRNLSKVPGTEVFKVPYEKKPEFDLQSAALLIKSLLDKNSLLYESIDYIIVEANYDSPGNFEINESLLLHILTTFPTSTVIAYSGTPQALANALQYHPRLQVMDKNNKLEEDISNICAYLPQMHNISVAPRVYSLAKLRQEMIEGKSRLRSSTLPEAGSPMFIPDFEARLRSSTVGNIYPLYPSKKEKQSQNIEEPTQTECSNDTDVEKLGAAFNKVKM